MTDPETGNQGATRRHGAAYQGAFEAVFAILIGGGIGAWADQHFGTSPRYLLIGLALGFGAFVLRLVRIGRAFEREQGAEASRDDEER